MIKNPMKLYASIILLQFTNWFFYKDGWKATGAIIALSMLLAGKTITERMEAHRANFISLYVVELLAIKSPTDIPVSIQVAIAAHESNWGRSRLSKKYNNYYGIKCHGSKGCIKMGKARWKTYESKEEGLMSFSTFVRANPRYKPCFNCNKKENVKERANCWAMQLHKQGYCPDKGYDKRLISTLNINNLYQLDQ